MIARACFVWLSQLIIISTRVIKSHKIPVNKRVFSSWKSLDLTSRRRRAVRKTLFKNRRRESKHSNIVINYSHCWARWRQSTHFPVLKQHTNKADSSFLISAVQTDCCCVFLSLPPQTQLYIQKLMESVPAARSRMKIGNFALSSLLVFWIYVYIYIFHDCALTCDDDDVLCIVDVV